MIRIKVVGKTNQSIVTIAKIKEVGGTEKPFLIDEYFVIEDELNGFPVCRVIETMELGDLSGHSDKSFVSEVQNSFKIPNLESGVASGDVKVYVCRAQLEVEIMFPVAAASTVREPVFADLLPILYTCKIPDGMPIGCIRGTNHLLSGIPKEFQNISPMFDMESGEVTNQTGAPFVFNYKQLLQFPHIGLFGGSGSGKTFALRVLIEEFIKRGVPNIVLDPHYEMNFEKPLRGLPKEFEFNFGPNVETFLIGKNIGIDFTKIWTDDLIEIMKFSGEMSQPMIATMYSMHFKGDTLGKVQALFAQLIDVFSKKESGASLNSSEAALHTKYASKISGVSTLIALSWRLNLLKREGAFECGIEEIEKAVLNRKTCVIRGPVKMLNVVGSYVVRSFFDKRRAYIDSKELGKMEKLFVPFVVTMDEAHTFIPNSSEYSPMKQIIGTISKEGRKYGIFEILATQRPKLLDTTVIAQLSTKMIFRTTVQEDINAIEKESDLSAENIKRLPFMTSGNCFVSSAITGRCVSIRFRTNSTAAKTDMNPFDELESFSTESKSEAAIKKMVPIKPENLAEVAIMLSKETGNPWNIGDVALFLEKMSSKGLLEVEKSCFGKVYR